MKYVFGVLLSFLYLVSSGQEKRSRPDIPGELMVDVGLNYWDSKSPGIAPNMWQSKSIGIYYVKRARISGRLSFYYGLGIGSEKMGIKTNSRSYYGFFVNGNESQLRQELLEETTDTRTFKKYKLATSYIDIPLDIRYHPFKTVQGSGFFVGVGVLGGVRFQAHDKLWTRDEGEKNKTKNHEDFGLNRFRYGFQFRLGFKGIHLFYKYYLSDQFNNPVQVLTYNEDEVLNPARIFDPKIRTFGINITGF